MNNILLLLSKMFFKKIFAFFLTLFVFVLHVIPGHDIMIFEWNHLFQIDKLFHFLIFGFLSISYFLCFNSVFYSIFFALIYGVFLETVQGLFFSYRHFDIIDLLADFLGSLFFISAFLKLKLNKYFNLD